jgi:hypothetical protein
MKSESAVRLRMQMWENTKRNYEAGSGFSEGMLERLIKELKWVLEDKC